MDNSKSKEELILENRLLREKLQIIENLQNGAADRVANLESDEFNILLEAAINLGSSLELKTLMQEATDKISHLTNIDTAAIYLLENDYLYMGGMTPPLDPNFPEDFRWTKLEGHTHISKAIETKEIVHVHDSKVEEFSPTEKIIIENRALRSIWYIPIFTAEETVGVFIIASLNEIQTCTTKQLDLSRALANLVAIALQQSLLHKKLEKKNEELRTTLLSIGDGVLSTDLNGNVILMNPVAERLCGYKFSEARGKSVTEIFKIYNPANREQLVNPVSKVLKEGKKINLANNTILVSKDGREYQISDSASPILNKDGVISGVVLVFSDVTNDYALKEALKHSESRLLKAEILGGFGNWEIDRLRNDVICSPGALKIFGMEGINVTIDELRKLPLPEYRELLDTTLHNFLNNNEAYDVEFKLRRPDGEIRFVHSNAVYDRKKEKVFGIINDITVRKKVEEALKRSEERYREFFMKDLTGDFLSSVEGKVLDCNPSFLKILGYQSLEELQLYHATNFYKNPEDRKKLLQKINSEREVRYFEIDMVKSNGEVVNIIENVHGIFDENGKLTHMRGYLFDITYIKKVETDLLLAKERAEDADRLKTEFLAQMSHEIRSPLNAVLSFTGVLEDLMSDNKTEEANICFSGIASASKRIITTVDSILNMSDLQLGIYHATKREINIVEILEILLKEYKSIADNKNIQLIFHTDVKEKVIYQDDYAFRQIMANLLDNALKYTKEGKVELKLETEQDFKISVIDTGIGISDEFLPNLFAPFSQEEQGYTRSYDGNGLGLALVKKYCDLIGAEIEVQSKKNKGTVFTIIFN